MKFLTALFSALAATDLAFPHPNVANQETGAAGGLNATVVASGKAEAGNLVPAKTGNLNPSGL